MSNEHSVDVESRARTHLANERTFHAWFRTGLAVVAFGLAAGQLLTPDVLPGVPLVRILATVALISGTFIVCVGLVRYRANRQRIDRAEFRAAGRSVDVSAAAAATIAVLAVVFVWLLRP